MAAHATSPRNHRAEVENATSQAVRSLRDAKMYANRGECMGAVMHLAFAKGYIAVAEREHFYGHPWYRNVPEPKRLQSAKNAFWKTYVHSSQKCGLTRG